MKRVLTTALSITLAIVMAFLGAVQVFAEQPE